MAPTQPTQPTQPTEPVAKSSGCGKDAASPRGAVREIDRRTFNTWGPSSYDPNRPYPVVLTFHGIGTNGRDFQKWFKMEEHVEGAAFTVYPDAERIWDLRGDGDLKFTAQIIEALASAHCIDRSRVFALGFSYGAKLVHHLGCKRPGLVRAISGGDGSWPRETDCSPVPVLVTHRTRDDDEQLAWGKDSAARWAKINGCSDETDTTDAAHGCVAYRGCKAPNTVTFCEDRFFDPKWPHDWNHTIREEYRDLTWAWFKSF
jgi:polyhydroxybutyrate depolymerase